MSLVFLYPLYLFGLVTALIPAIIHLLNRRRLKRIRFPAVKFILLSQRRISRTYRLRHWFLLALRTLAVLLLVLLLAHPIFQTGVGLSAGSGPASFVVIMDNSLSMKWSRDGEGFDQAKEALRRLVSSLRDGDRMAFVPTNALETGGPRLIDAKEILARLDALEISGGTANFSLALSKAYELLKEPAARKEIWLITDMALTGWDQFSLASLSQYDPSIPVKVIHVSSRGEALNATVKEVRIRSQGVAVGLPIELEAPVVNFTDRKIENLIVQLHLDGGKVDQRLVSLPPQGELSVKFQFRAPQKPGSHHGQIQLQAAGLAGNPKVHFSIFAQDKLKLLIVDGDPKTSLVLSETFFLTRALNPAGAEDSSLFHPEVIIPETLSSVSLDSYQAVILCNVPAIPDSFVPRLREYLIRGGGLILFLGDRVQADDYHRKLIQISPSILPGRLAERKTTPAAEGERVARIAANHPVLGSLTDRLIKESLLSTRVRTYFRVDSQDNSTLLTLANGDPFLIEKKLGAGRVLLVATTADRDWSDLPLKTAYVPLVQSMASYLSRSEAGLFDAGITVGASKTFSLPSSSAGRKLSIVKPDGKTREIELTPQGEKLAASFQENDLPGIYRTSLPSTPAASAKSPDLYAVNPPFLESRLQTIREEELLAKLRPIRADIIPLDSLEKGGTRIDLAFPLVFFIMATLVAEGWLAQRMHG